MYLNFYHLKKEPFNVTPDPAFLFLSRCHKEALASIIYAVENRKGFLVITGDVGVGKTTILRSYLETVDREKLKTIYVLNPNVSFKALLKTIFQELNIYTETDEVFEMVNHLQQVLIDEYKHQRNVVLIIDEVQNMPLETLENLRTLSNLETSTDKLIQIVLIGQTEFEKILNRNEIRQLRQRIAIRTVIYPLKRPDSIAYINHRLNKALGNDAMIFTRGALKLIARKGRGIPRNLNILCDNALITGYGYQKNPVTSRIVKEVIADFEGKKKFSSLRWGIAVSTVLLLLTGLFWIYSNKKVILSELWGKAVSITSQSNMLDNDAVPLVKAETPGAKK